MRRIPVNLATGVKKKMHEIFLIFFFISSYAFAQLNSHVPPGSNFDLSAWKLQTLDDNLAFIEKTPVQLQAGHTSIYFYTDSVDGSMVFKVPCNGNTTSGSSYPRVE